LPSHRFLQYVFIFEKINRSYYHFHGFDDDDDYDEVFYKAVIPSVKIFIHVFQVYHHYLLSSRTLSCWSQVNRKKKNKKHTLDALDQYIFHHDYPNSETVAANGIQPCSGPSTMT
jgi:hypothetical protein